MKAVLLISHGSRSPETKKEVADLADRLQSRRAAEIIEFAFLELESPSIPEGIDICVTKGADKIIILLNFLNSGRHVDSDIPEIVAKARLKHPQITISITKPVGQHPKIEDLFLDLLKS
jgi:sirohydrochlorin ferrochelatase